MYSHQPMYTCPDPRSDEVGIRERTKDVKSRQSGFSCVSRCIYDGLCKLSDGNWNSMATDLIKSKGALVHGTVFPQVFSSPCIYPRWKLPVYPSPFLNLTVPDPSNLQHGQAHSPQTT